MPHMLFEGINDAFRTLVRIFSDHGKPGLNTSVTETRAGKVIMFNDPVVITYTNPTKRVLLNAARDYNPFFCLYESLWMLAGKEDVTSLAYYNNKITEFSDDDKVLNGAYGNRWRNWKVPLAGSMGYLLKNFHGEECKPGWGSIDQLQVIADHLHQNQNSRRAVLEMWSVHSDLLRLDSKDVCCNTHVYFAIRESELLGHAYQLDMTVCNRSNDLIWSVLASDYTCFSVLHEYMAALINRDGPQRIRVGNYHLMTNNLHVYLDRWKPTEWLEEYRDKMLCSHCYPTHSPKEYVEHGTCPRCGVEKVVLWPKRYQCPVAGYHQRPMIYDVNNFSLAVKEFVEDHKKLIPLGVGAKNYRGESFLNFVAAPMMYAYHWYRHGDFSTAKLMASTIEADDWRWAANTWIDNRIKRRESGNVKS